ncbi:MAG TPA: glucose-6-phosphate isomerase [Steroidobacteraceae bacterium]|nr:glucose-6-phosphate isomerase [Steroidobacteraceae bacterium]
MAEELTAAVARLAARPVAGLFAADPGRFGRFSREACGLLLDFSRQRLDAAALDGLVALAESRGIAARRGALLAGEPVNGTEKRAALHTLLRTPSAEQLPAALRSLHAEVLAVRAQCREFVGAVHAGRLTGATGERFTDVVNVGIGGSDLGPAMAALALAPYDAGLLRCHFVSNVDGTQFADLAPVLDPARTLVIICSKTFTTQETLANAKRVRAWLASRLGESAVPRHFAAVSTNHAAMDAFGVGRESRFTMWDWVGGRYSLWSAVGLALELAIGSRWFEEMLAGARAMDEHFATTAVRDNLPVLLGLIAHWNRNFLGCESHAVLPYTQRLARLPAYLQQLEMESLGKRTTREGSPVAGQTGAVIWGEPGSNAQHSFFQLLHQGTAAVSADFLLPLTGAADPAADELAIANCLAQMQAMMAGHAATEPHRVHPGSRPISLIAFTRLDPATLGALVALYEHKVFVESVLWDINPFDQWGVELGKKICANLLPLGQAPAPAELADLARWIEARRRR